MGFSSCIFPSLVVNTHIISLVFIIPFVFEHFGSQLAFVGFVVQPCKCLVWSSFDLFFGFFAPFNFRHLSNNIKVLGVPLGSASFISFFNHWTRIFAM
jgi:hypothetical protein